jgi:hypothetical protein
MPFDANLVLVDGSADWSYANLVTSSYGTPTSTTRNDGGFAVIDLGSTHIGASWKGIAAVLVLTEAADATSDALTCTIEESTSEGFTVPHELAKFDIAAATMGVILGSEVPATVIRRVSPTLRYIRCKATVPSGDDFNTVYCLLSPYPFEYL